MAQIQKGTTYSTGDQVTATNLNALADAAILLPGAITDQTAKTVPLAADTVLIHSAADTALRKSTLTQLFANATGIPISTGISGLGTGIATALAVNSGSTGAPALLGSAGAFTTLSASSTAAVAFSATRSNAGTVAQFIGPSQSAYIYTDTNGIYLGSDSAQNTALYLNETSDTITAYTGGAARATFTSTGLNSTAIGATTASTGAFTTLSASGSISGVGFRSSTNNSPFQGTTTGAAAQTLLVLGADDNTYIDYGSGKSFIVYDLAGATRATFSSTGLAVTGALSSTGAATFSSAASVSSGSVMISNSDPTIRFVVSGGTADKSKYEWRAIAAGGANDYFQLRKINDANSVFTELLKIGNDGAVSMINGLAVTGALSSTTGANFATSSGSVGIGTTSIESGFKLHVTGNGFFSQSSGTVGKVVVDNADQRLVLGAYYEAGVGQYAFISSTNNAETGGLDLRFRTGTDERMTIASTSGNVGIGTASPAAKLHVNAGEIYIQNGDYGRLNFIRGSTNIWAIGPRNTDDLYIRRESGSANVIFDGGNVTITGALSKGSGSFRIEHPLPEKSATHQLVHSFIEGPQADLIYRGKVVLVDGKASVNIDSAATMTEGTFEVLCREVQCFTTNESGWTAVRGKVTGNILTIEAKDADCTDEISWMVIGERQDPHMMETDWTDDNGKVIVEPLKPSIESN
jgi:hypothetical protein